MLKLKNIYLGNIFIIIIFAIIINHPILVFANSNYNLEDLPKISLINKRNNIVLILIDTLRADHLSCYGYKRNTSPNIDKIASEGVRFTDFYTVCPWTNPTIASLFTGKYPGVMSPPRYYYEQGTAQALPEEIDTLAEVLKKDGYHTFALVDAPGINEELKYNQGFDEFITLFNKTENWVKGSKPSDVLASLSEQLDMCKDNYFFAYIHLFYPHIPYYPPPPFREMFGEGFHNFSRNEKEGVINMYDGEIRYTDELIGNIFDNLKERKLLNNTYVIITADHGEGFWEHGLSTHGNSLYNELLKIPLIIYFPGGRTTQPKTIDGRVSNIDLFPTIMDFAKIEDFPKPDGDSLSKYFNKENTTRYDEMIFSENQQSGRHVNPMSCQNEQYKLIFNGRYTIPEMANHILLLNHIQLYDIKRDPLERYNIAMMKIFTSIKMSLRLFEYQMLNDRRRNVLKQIKKKAFDKDTIEKLKSVGYLQ
jgi:arylsulfatase A-like enzyme